MKFLHTADWHLGQTFYEYDRTAEHQAFLDWLKHTIEKEKIDVLLVAGDIFETANPAASTVRLFYDFLNHISSQQPELQTFIIAGNHDSAIRLETPTPLLAGTNIHLVGQVKKTDDHQIDYEKLIYPVQQNNETVACCVAVPFLRLGDYPKSDKGGYDYLEGITRFYEEILDEAQDVANGKPIIVMGHLHASGTDFSVNDTAERAIMGGIEGLSINTLAEKADYWALGHIHKPQAIGGNQHIRYSGSPVPLSFSEIDYPHQVVIFEVNKNKVQNIDSLLIPVDVPLINIPKNGYKDLESALEEIRQLPEKESFDTKNYPYLQVRIAMDKPNPDIKPKIQQEIANKAVRLAKIDARMHISNDKTTLKKQPEIIDLQSINPKEVLKKSFENKYNQPLPDYYETMLNTILADIDQQKNQR